MLAEQEEEVIIQEEEVLEEEIETTEEVIEDEGRSDEEESGEEENEGDEEEAEEADEDIILLGDEEVNAPDPEEKRAPKWVKDLRKQNKELQKQLKEQKVQLEQSAPAPSLEPLGKRPTLEDSEYDSEQYETKLIAYLKKEQEQEKGAKKQVEEQEEVQRAFQRKFEEYNVQKTSLKVRDYDDAEQVVLESLSEVQQNVILQTAEKPALLVYAIGKSKGKAEALAKITDPAKLAYELGKLEGKLKVGKRKATSSPERKLSGKGGATGTLQNGLDKVRAEAEKTGDYSGVRRYKQKHNL